MDHKAKISNRRHAPNCNGSTICDVTCPACGHTATVSYGGWSGLQCGGCKSTLYRFEPRCWSSNPALIDQNAPSQRRND